LSRRRYPLGSNDALLIPRFLFGPQPFHGGYQAQFSHFLPTHPYYLAALDGMPAWLKKPLARLLFRSFAALLFFGKPEARRGNRLTVSTQRDCHGVPQLDVHYQPSANDAAMKESMLSYGTRILRKASGLVVTRFTEPTPGRSIHYAGTCRMASSPQSGIVDAQLCSFDHPNLYLCDGSVLPEISEKNLTLTILALADRLAADLMNSASRAP